MHAGICCPKLFQRDRDTKDEPLLSQRDAHPALAPVVQEPPLSCSDSTDIASILTSPAAGDGSAVERALPTSAAPDGVTVPALTTLIVKTAPDDLVDSPADELSGRPGIATDAISAVVIPVQLSINDAEVIPASSGICPATHQLLPADASVSLLKGPGGANDAVPEQFCSPTRPQPLPRRNSSPQHPALLIKDKVSPPGFTNAAASTLLPPTPILAPPGRDAAANAAEAKEETGKGSEGAEQDVPAVAVATSDVVAIKDSERMSPSTLPFEAAVTELSLSIYPVANADPAVAATDEPDQPALAHGTTGAHPEAVAVVASEVASVGPLAIDSVGPLTVEAPAPLESAGAVRHVPKIDAIAGTAVAQEAVATLPVVVERTAPHEEGKGGSLNGNGKERLLAPAASSSSSTAPKGAGRRGKYKSKNKNKK